MVDADPAVARDVRSGKFIVSTQAARPESRRTAVVVGASALGVKVARALQGGDEQRRRVRRLLRRPRRRAHRRRSPGQGAGQALPRSPPTSTEHGVREVYITLPLGSQPRIVELLEQLQGTTASLFFVPDVFGISIIQGRLQDMNGVPVVGICETPFTGTNQLVKRVSDVVLATSSSC